MRGIMFNKKYGLESAVLKGYKTRTWRADKKPRYEVGEIVAIKQCYCMVYGENKDFIERKISKDALINEIFTCAGWNNKMFVKNELMPHQIKITKVTPCELQDITEEECLREGIYVFVKSMFNFDNSEMSWYDSAKEAFADLINKLNGKDYWGSNPSGFAYEFELIK